MTASVTPLYLPLSQHTVDDLLASKQDQLEQILQQLHWCELPGLLTLQTLPKMVEQSTSLSGIERFLSKAFRLAKHLNAKQSSNKLITELMNVFSLDEFGVGASMIEEAHLRLMSLDAVEAGEYLDLNGDWDFAFKEKYIEKLQPDGELVDGSSPYLTEEQYRVVSTVRANLDDHLHVEGYAGTGKTYQVNAILNVLQEQGVDAKRVIILTQTYAQRVALLAKLPTGTQVITCGWLAKSLIPEDLTDKGLRHLKQHKYEVGMSDAQYAQLMNLSSLASLNSTQIAKAIRDTVKNYCYSTDADISSEHIPKWIQLQLNRELTPANIMQCSPMDMLLSYANIYWQQLLTPPTGQLSPKLLEMHIIKFVSLNDWSSLSHQYSHILVDESHDLSSPVRDILNRLNFPTISFGDRFQSMKDGIEKIPAGIRQKSICHSVRAGSGLDCLVNPILSSHPKQIEQPFIGSAMHRTELKVYKKAEIPEKNTAIFVSTLWGLFEWVQRLTFNGLPVRVLGVTKELSGFVQDVIELFHNGIKPRHGLLLQYHSWNAIYKDNYSLQSFKSVHQMLEQGYKISDWERAASLITDNPAAPYTLSTLSNARNSEFDTVYITPDMMDVAWSPHKQSFSKTASELYIGTTRVRNRLYIPELMQHWIEDLQSE